MTCIETSNFKGDKFRLPRERFIEVCTACSSSQLRFYTVAQKERIFFPNNCNFFIFNIKKIMLTPKQPVINAVLITYIYYSITENYIGKMAYFLPYTRPEPLLKLLHHIY